MHALMVDLSVIPLKEVDAADVHDGNVMEASWDKERLEMEAEQIRAFLIALQYKPVLCPRCVILNGEKPFGSGMENENDK